MTYPVSDKFPAWPGYDHVFEAKANATAEKDGYFTRSFWMLEALREAYGGPAHSLRENYTLPDSGAPFVRAAVVIDVRDEVEKNADYRLTVVRVKKWEAEHGEIPRGRLRC